MCDACHTKISAAVSFLITLIVMSDWRPWSSPLYYPHGPIGSKQEALDHGQYLRELHEQVMAGKSEGHSVDELKTSIKMENYKSWSQYDAWLGLNIEGMYGYVE